MKKILSLIVAAVMLMSIFTSCGKENLQEDGLNVFPVDTSDLEENIIEPHSVDFASFSLDGSGNVFAVSNETVCKFSLEGEFLEEYPGVEDVSALCCYSDSIIAATYSGRLVKIDTETKEITEITDQLGETAYDIAVIGETVYTVGFSYNNSLGSVERPLMSVDINGGKPNKVSNESINSMYAASDGETLYCYSSDTKELYRLDNGKLVSVKSLGILSEIFAFIVENGYFCYSNNLNGENQLLKINLNSEDVTPERITSSGIYLQNILGFGALRYQKGNVYYVDSSKGEFASVFLEPAPEKVETKPKESDPKSLVAGGVFFYSAIKDSSLSAAARESGLEGKYKEIDNIELKILAGDSDVDIYFVPAYTIQTLINKGIYVPIDSETITEFNSGCFDYIDEMTKDKNGQTVAMPIYDYTDIVAYPVQAAEELGFTREEISYYDSFQSIVTGDRTSRKTYIEGTMTLFYDIDTQYSYFYCDYENKVADYQTDLYRHLYSHLEGWPTGSGYPVPKGYYSSFLELGSRGGKLMFDRDKTLFTVSVRYEDLIDAMIVDPFYKDDMEFDLNDWRAIHMPWITEEVDKSIGNVWFAIINPYSKHYDEAVKALEYVAENYFDSVNKYASEYPIIRKDINEYPESYHTETAVFQDVFEICRDQYILRYAGPGGVRNDVNEFQAGRLTMDEAIAEYQRQVDIWLNE